MNTDNGALEFEAYINNERLNSTALEAERRIKGLSNTAVSEGKKVESSFNAVGASIAAIGGAAALGMIGKQILDTTAKFEKFGIVLRNTLGDSEGNAALDMIAQFAATTPFQLDEVTGAFIKMANQGFVPTRDELVKLGDLASSTGKSFDQLTEALLDAQTGQFERLKEFGIKASAQGDKVTFSFKEQQTTVDNTNSAIQAYILSLGELQGVQGANAKISASLTGQISNLGDKLAAMYNEIGKANSGVLYAAVEGASTLVDNYELIGKVLVGLVATYGAHTAAVIIATSATKGYTIASQIEYGWLLMVEKAQALLNKTMLKNPYVAAAVAITAIVSGLIIYASSLDDVTEAEKARQNVQDKASKQYDEQKTKIDVLVSTLRNEKIALEERQKALKELQGIVPGYHASLTAEGKLINDNKTAIDEYLRSLEKEIYLQATKDEKVELTKKKRLKEKEVAKKELNAKGAEEAANVQVVGASQFSQGSAGLMAGQARGFANKAKRELQEINDAIKAIDEEYAKWSNSIPEKKDKPVSETPAQKKARLKEEAKDAKEHERLVKEFNSEKLDAQKAFDKAELDLMRSKITDKKDLIDLELEQTLKAIDEQEALYKEKALKAGITNPDLTLFSGMRSTAKAQAVTDKAAVDKAEQDAAKQRYDALLDEFGTYEQKRLKVATDYGAKRAEAEKNGNLALAQQITEAEQKALSDLTSNMITGSAEWTKLFSDLDTLSVSKIIELRDKIEAQWSKLNLSPEALKALRDQLDKATETVQKKNPFLALADGVKNYDKSKPEQSVKKIANAVVASADYVNGNLQNVLGALDSLGVEGMDEIKQVAGQVMGMMDDASNLAMGIASGNPMQIISSTISLISKGIDMIAGAKDRKLERSIQRHAEEVKKLEAAYKELEKAIDKALGSDRYSTQKATIENLKKQQVEYAAMAQAERNKKKTDKGKVDEYNNSIESAKDKIDEIITSLREDILGSNASTAANDLGNALLDAFAKGEDAAVAWGKKVDDIVGGVIRKMLIQKLVEQPVGDIINRYMAKWVDSEGNFLGFDSVMTSAAEMGKELAALGPGLSGLINNLPDDIKKYLTGETAKKDTSPLTGAIQGMTEDTANVLSGYANAIRINQIESITVLRNQLSALNQIASNTSYNINLVEILNVLRSIYGSNTLRAQGL